MLGIIILAAVLLCEGGSVIFIIRAFNTCKTWQFVLGAAFLVVSLGIYVTAVMLK